MAEKGGCQGADFSDCTTTGAWVVGYFEKRTEMKLSMVSVFWVLIDRAYRGLEFFLNRRRFRILLHLCACRYHGTLGIE